MESPALRRSPVGDVRVLRAPGCERRGEESIGRFPAARPTTPATTTRTTTPAAAAPQRVATRQPSVVPSTPPPTTNTPLLIDEGDSRDGWPGETPTRGRELPESRRRRCALPDCGQDHCGCRGSILNRCLLTHFAGWDFRGEHFTHDNPDDPRAARRQRRTTLRHQLAQPPDLHRRAARRRHHRRPAASVGRTRELAAAQHLPGLRLRSLLGRRNAFRLRPLGTRQRRARKRERHLLHRRSPVVLPLGRRCAGGRICRAASASWGTTSSTAATWRSTNCC